MWNSCEETKKPKTTKVLLKSWYLWKPVMGITLGAFAGYLYYYFVGCKSGTCPITSSAWSTMLFGGFIGLSLTNGPCKKSENKSCVTEIKKTEE